MGGHPIKLNKMLFIILVAHWRREYDATFLPPYVRCGRGTIVRATSSADNAIRYKITLESKWDSDMELTTELVSLTSLY